MMKLLERPRSTSPVPAAGVRVYRRIEDRTMRDMNLTVKKADLTPKQKEQRKTAKKCRKILVADEDGGKVEAVGRNVCQALGISLIQMSDYERGQVTDSKGNKFQSPAACDCYDGMNEFSDSD